MANSTLKVLHRQAVKTEAQWKSSDPVIPLGVLAISSDKHGIYKCGNGTSKWSALPYAFDAAAYNSPFYGTCGEMDGLPGLVPAPKKNDINKFLNSNGEWTRIYQRGEGKIEMGYNEYYGTDANGGWSVKLIKFDTPFDYPILPTILTQQTGFAIKPMPISIIQTPGSPNRPEVDHQNGFFAGVYGSVTSEQPNDEVTFKWIAIG